MPVRIDEHGKPRSDPDLDHEIEDLIADISALGDAGDIILDMIQRGDFDSLDELLGAAATVAYDEVPVDMETFLFDDAYMGAVGRTLYPQWVEDIKEIFDGNYHEVILTGGIGIGKNTMASLIIARMIYEILCARDPQAMFGLESGSEIAVPCISVNELVARRVVLFGIRQKFLQSPWFTRFQMRGGEKEIRITEKSVRLYPSGVSLGGVLSTNAVGGIIDEANFLGSTPPSITRVRYGGKSGRNIPSSFAETLYVLLSRRVKSRFERHGKLPGKLVVISSVSHEKSFIDRRISESIGEPGVFVRSYAVWEAKPRDLFSPKVFWVIIDQSGSTSIVDTEDERDQAVAAGTVDGGELGEGVVVVEVPQDFKEDFQKDVDGALQDLAGVSFVGAGHFFRNRVAISECVDQRRQHPVAVETWIAGEKLTVFWSKLTHKIDVVDERGRVMFDRHGRPRKQEVPILNPDAPRYVHIDTAQNRDALGFAMVHSPGIVEVRRRDRDGDLFVERMPAIYVDFMLQVKAPPGGEIVFSDIRRLFYRFLDHGFPVAMVTVDQFQSLELRQYIERQRGVEAKLLSVDRTTEPYKELRSAIYDRRLSMYYYRPVIREMADLVWVGEKDKVDHPDGGSKDVSDALAGAVFSLVQDVSDGELVLPLMGHEDRKSVYKTIDRGYSDAVRPPSGKDVFPSEKGGNDDDGDDWEPLLPSMG